MEIIPVLDLMGGQVVRAQCGNRHLYQPIRSQLCSSSEPEHVAEALLGLYPFDYLYIADLDAIQGTGDNLELVAALRKRLEGPAILLDAGFTTPQQINSARALGLRCVLGSERLQSVAHYASLLECAEPDQCWLSLDFSALGFLGPEALLNAPQLWPDRLICMTLARVGSYAGPDLARLCALRSASATRRIYAAGGVRGAEDLQALAEAGISGALIASLLHDRNISTSEICAWQQAVSRQTIPAAQNAMQ